MASTQKYSLRWNDFSQNVASTFRDLHLRQDFADVTLACSDGSTLEAHKFILSSVSSYFRDLLKNAPCNHPIVILKDTCREEARAVLDFAYTGEVNVNQELLPSLLHTARSFRIKGLDNVQAPPGVLDLNNGHSNDHENHWGSRPPTRPHTPSTRPHSPQTRSHTPSTRPHSPAQSLSHPHSPNSVQSLEPHQHHHHQQQQHHNNIPPTQQQYSSHHHSQASSHHHHQHHQQQQQHHHTHHNSSNSSTPASSVISTNGYQTNSHSHHLHSSGGVHNNNPTSSANSNNNSNSNSSSNSNNLHHLPPAAHQQEVAEKHLLQQQLKSAAARLSNDAAGAVGDEFIVVNHPYHHLSSAQQHHHQQINHHQRGSKSSASNSNCSTPRSQPPTRPSSPAAVGNNSSYHHHTNNSARTPPPKRWKRSFDMTRSSAVGPDDSLSSLVIDHDSNSNGPTTTLHNNNSNSNSGPSTPYLNGNATTASSEDMTIETNGGGSQDQAATPIGLLKRVDSASIVSKQSQRFNSTDSERRFAEADSAVGRRFSSGLEPRGMGSYPHSMPASPTMLDHRNIGSLGLLRHFSRIKEENEGLSAPDSRKAAGGAAAASDHDPLDYRFQSAALVQSTEDVEKEKERQERLAFRPESAPTVLDMSPETSRHSSMDNGIKHENDERLTHFRNLVTGNIHPLSVQDSISDCISKSLNGSLNVSGSSSPNSNCGGAGRYSCDECGKLFRHPGSLQHHRHIHRGTHRCPSCGKAFSRRWDMERHLNKSKFGCPANRFSSPRSAASTPTHHHSGMDPLSLTSPQHQQPPPGAGEMAPAVLAAANQSFVILPQSGTNTTTH